jgi:hypothetical protein
MKVPSMYAFLVCVAGLMLLLQAANAHMRLLQPMRFGGLQLGGIGVEPDALTADRFPCGKPPGTDEAVFYDWSNPTVMAQGEHQPLKFQCSPSDGCAIHSGMLMTARCLGGRDENSC